MISRILYYIVLKPLSLLPLGVLYYISDFLYLIIYKLFGYRKKVVKANLKSVFKDKSDAEILSIEKAYYKHLCDIVVESVKVFSISAEELQMRMKVHNPEILEKYRLQNRTCMCVTAHYGNYEWAGISFPLHNKKYHAWGLYQKLNNSFFDKKMKVSRGKFGVNMVQSTQVNAYLAGLKEKVFMAGFIADQKPINPKTAIWTLFLGRETGFSKGAELYARKFNSVMLYGEVVKIKRGFYTLEYKVICEDLSSEENFLPSKKFIKLLETQITKQPEYWLWSHKRWKHARPEGCKMV